MHIGRILSVAVSALCLLSCNREKDNTSYTLVYGGDLFLGRGINEALFDPAQRAEMFGDTAPLFRGASIALVNGEGVISKGGILFDKGEPRPFMFRAHPYAVDVLKGAGIDVVNAGNNHACDYGREALREMLDRLRIAGIDYTGAGLDVIDSRTASFHKLGNLTVAIIGADMTIAGLCSAQEKLPGVLFYDISSPQASIDTVVRDLTGVLKRAREHADLVFLTPHWGDNGKDAPTETTRQLAARLIKAGFDGILGHSAHRFQGVEIIDGKPVIYDAGQLIDDMGGAQAMIWELKFNRKGVVAINGHPIRLQRNRTMLADAKNANSIVERLRKLSEPFGTALFVKDNTVSATCRPNGHAAPSDPPPERPVPKTVRLAVSDLVRDTMPADTTPAEVVYENGITLVGYKLYTDKLSVPKGAQVTELYFKAAGKLTGNIHVHLDAVSDAGGRDADRHIPGDWLMPVSIWPRGRLITDRKLFRLKSAPKGTMVFTAALVDQKLLKPLKSSLPMKDDYRFILGEATYTEGAPRIYHFIHQVDALRSGK